MQTIKEILNVVSDSVDHSVYTIGHEYCCQFEHTCYPHLSMLFYSWFHGPASDFIKDLLNKPLKLMHVSLWCHDRMAEGADSSFLASHGVIQISCGHNIPQDRILSISCHLFICTFYFM